MLLLRYQFLFFFLGFLVASCAQKQIGCNSNRVQESWIKASQEIEAGHASIVYTDTEATVPAINDKSFIASNTNSVKDDGIKNPVILKNVKKENKKPSAFQVIKAIKKAKSSTENNPTAMDAFVLSLLGLLLPPLISLFVLGPPGLLVVVNLLGFVLLMLGFGKGIKALKELKQYQEQKGRGFAITAIVFGVLGILAIITALLIIGGL